MSELSDPVAFREPLIEYLLDLVAKKTWLFIWLLFLWDDRALLEKLKFDDFWSKAFIEEEPKIVCFLPTSVFLNWDDCSGLWLYLNKLCLSLGSVGDSFCISWLLFTTSAEVFKALFSTVCSSPALTWDDSAPAIVELRYFGEISWTSSKSAVFTRVFSSFSAAMTLVSGCCEYRLLSSVLYIFLFSAEYF